MTKIGQYEIRELLGEGGIGQVHVAVDTVLDREVAIKSLRPELLSDSNFIDRFRAEATSLARLNHPNITTLYSLLPDGRNLYMVMERVRGHPLDTILEKRKGPLGIREALAIIAQAADGLGYAHSMGVIHRDIKPANVMVAENGLVKIMDFGIARVRGSQRLTRDGSIVGTLAYMAPEQLRGEPGDERSDVYSLAIVLYEMLSGAPPFRAESDYEIMQAQINKRPERLSPHVAGLDPRLESALLRALSKKPEQRFPSMRSFSDAIGATSLRLDAPKILHDDTRLIEPQDLPKLAPQSGVSRLSDRLPASPAMRIALAAAVLLVVGGATAGAIFWSTRESPKVVVATAAGQPPAAAPRKPVAVTPAPAPKPVQPSAAARPPAERPVVAERPAAEKPVAGQPVAEKPAAEKPVAEKPVGEKPAAKEPAAEGAAPAAATVAPAPAGAPSAPAASESAESKGADAAATAVTVADVAAAITRKDYDKAAELVRPLAKAENREAQFILGRLYDVGLGVPQDNQEAVAWYLKAANHDLDKAQYYLGLMYENGRGVPKSTQEAAAWYRKAALQNYAVAQNDLGIMYSVGQGVERDDRQAVVWYLKAAGQDYAKAQKNLGDMYLQGRGVARDDQQAIYWYLKAARQGHADAQYLLGYMYEKGRGTEPDDKQAADWYQKAAAAGNAEAQRALDRIRTRIGGNQ